MPARTAGHQQPPQPKVTLGADEVVGVLGTELEALMDAVNYRDWLFAAAEPYLGRRVLEVGAGIGTMTSCLGDRDLVVALEYTPEYARELERKFAADPAVRVVQGDATDAALMSRLAALQLDSAMTFNVLEHIEDDVAALRGIHDALVPGGHLVAFVPAGPAILGTMDRAIGHYRRYTRRELAAKANRVGFEVLALYHMNVVGYVLWLLRGRVLRTANITGSRGQIRQFDRLVVPRLRALESRWRPPFGQSLVLVGRRLIQAGPTA